MARAACDRLGRVRGVHSYPVGTEDEDELEDLRRENALLRGRVWELEQARARDAARPTVILQAHALPIRPLAKTRVLARVENRHG